MTNKIIIDGIDVSKCKSFFKGIKEHNICCYFDTREDKIPFATFCEENPDCDFKRHARAKEENEELKNDYAELEKENEELLKYKKMQEKELLELRTRIEYYIEKQEQLLNDIDNMDRFNDELQEENYNLNISLYQFNGTSRLNEKYKQVLDKIEKLISEALDPEKTEIEQSFDNFYACLDIIEKSRKE